MGALFEPACQCASMCYGRQARRGTRVGLASADSPTRVSEGHAIVMIEKQFKNS
jgi:hypothetical protein